MVGKGVQSGWHQVCMDGNNLHAFIVGKAGVDWSGGAGLSLSSRSVADACCHEHFLSAGERGTLSLAVPPLPALPVIPPAPTLAVPPFTLTPFFPLITFDKFLVSSILVLVPLPVVGMTEAFMVGMEVLISKYCL